MGRQPGRDGRGMRLHHHLLAFARRLRSGMVHLNGARLDFSAPFGGYKQSGNGREWGVESFEEFLETKSVFGYGAE